MELKNLKDEEIVKLIKTKQIKLADIVDAGICPTCFNKAHDNVVYGDISDLMLYEDDDFECFLVGNPRVAGHAAISTKKHFKDMLAIDDQTCTKIFILAKNVMIALKETYNAESVYLCTMCDGPMNHFHVQLIPRMSYEERGSDNFVKPRIPYQHDPEKVAVLRKKLNYDPTK